MSNEFYLYQFDPTSSKKNPENNDPYDRNRFKISHIPFLNESNDDDFNIINKKFKLSFSKTDSEKPELNTIILKSIESYLKSGLIVNTYHIIYERDLGVQEMIEFDFKDLNLKATKQNFTLIAIEGSQLDLSVEDSKSNLYYGYLAYYKSDYTFIDKTYYTCHFYKCSIQPILEPQPVQANQTRYKGTQIICESFDLPKEETNTVITYSDTTRDNKLVAVVNTPKGDFFLIDYPLREFVMGVTFKRVLVHIKLDSR